MLILPSDGSTFQVNYSESFGRALSAGLEHNPDLTVVADKAFDDYHLGAALDNMLMDHDDSRVQRLGAGQFNQAAFLCQNSVEFQQLFANWTDSSPKPLLWCFPVNNATDMEFPDGYSVLMPSSTQDAFSLTRSCFEDGKPTIVLQHESLHEVEGYVNLDLRLDPAPLTRRAGKDVTLFAASWLVIEALQAAEVLASRGIDATVVDLRWLEPLEKSTFAMGEAGRRIVVDHIPLLRSLRENLGSDSSLRFTSDMTDAIGTMRVVRSVEQTLGLQPTDTSQVSFYGYGRTFCGPF